jgi:hypothetical protein
MEAPEEGLAQGFVVAMTMQVRKRTWFRTLSGPTSHFVHSTLPQIGYAPTIQQSFQYQRLHVTVQMLTGACDTCVMWPPELICKTPKRCLAVLGGAYSATVAATHLRSRQSFEQCNTRRSRVREGTADFRRRSKVQERGAGKDVRGS